MANVQSPFGNWQAWHPCEIVRLFSSLSVPWWIAGGWALDLFLGEQTREHGDIDVQILRRDQQSVRSLLQNWDIQAVLHPTVPPNEWPFRVWKPDTLLDAEVHNIWCRPDKTAPWTFELLIENSRDDEWLFRRDPRITRPLSTIRHLTDDGIPYLAPEIQLLYKSRSLRPKDESDFARVFVHLDQESRQWLAQSLTLVHPHHPWLLQLESR